MSDFVLIPTLDGSLSLRITKGEGTTESMHSHKGAFSESKYIYGDALECLLSQSLSPKVLSLGLGLGYNEIIAMAVTIHKTGSGLALDLDSFEVLSYLREWFTAWLNGDAGASQVAQRKILLDVPPDVPPEVPPEILAIYEDTLNRAAQTYGLKAAAIKEQLALAFQQGRIRINAEFAAQSLDKTYNCYFYDAFCGKTDPHLWQEDFIQQVLAKSTEPDCVFATYACTGALKRALKGAGFHNHSRPGFGTKRESTFATRFQAKL